MYAVVFLVGGLTFSLIGWPVAWVVAFIHGRVRDTPRAARVRWIVMGVLGVAQYFFFASDYFGVPSRYLPGLLLMVLAYPLGWLAGAWAFESVVRAISLRRALTA